MIDIGSLIWYHKQVMKNNETFPVPPRPVVQAVPNVKDFYVLDAEAIACPTEEFAESSLLISGSQLRHLRAILNGMDLG